MEEITLHIEPENDRDAPEILKNDDEAGALAIDIFETDAEIVILAPIAGVDERSLDLELTEDLLKISGERPRPKNVPATAKFLVEECFWGKFSRNILLPAAVNSAEISATLENEILIIKIPKARKVAKKKISLKK